MIQHYLCSVDFLCTSLLIQKMNKNLYIYIYKHTQDQTQLVLSYIKIQKKKVNMLEIF